MNVRETGIITDTQFDWELNAISWRSAGPDRRTRGSVALEVVVDVDLEDFKAG